MTQQIDTPRSRSWRGLQQLITVLITLQLPVSIKQLAMLQRLDLTTTQQNALKEKGIGFISDIDLQGQEVNNRYINSVTHSANGEFIDDVFNSSGVYQCNQKFNYLNITANQTNKTRANTCWTGS